MSMTERNNNKNWLRSRPIKTLTKIPEISTIVYDSLPYLMWWGLKLTQALTQDKYTHIQQYMLWLHTIKAFKYTATTPTNCELDTKHSQTIYHVLWCKE